MDTTMIIQIPGKRITKAVIRKDGTCELSFENVTPIPTDVFKLVEASKLSINDEFLQYEPNTRSEQRLKRILQELIQSGLKDFHYAQYPPTFNEHKTGILFKKDGKPVDGQTLAWWNRVARNFLPEHGSRLGTKNEYVAFLGTLIKELVAAGCSSKYAWNIICNSSEQLLEDEYEYIFLTDDSNTDRFWIAGNPKPLGCFPRSMFDSLFLYDLSFVNNWKHAAGWVVLES